MSTIASVKPNPNKPETGFVKFDDGTEAWTPEVVKVEALIGKPVPDGWTLREGDRGKQLLPPREKKGGGGGFSAAFRNTEAGQRVEQDQMNRRTALMQAVTVSIDQGAVLKLADDYYAWLSRPSVTSDRPKPVSPSNPPGLSAGGTGTTSADSEGEAAATARQGGESPQRSDAIAPVHGDTAGSSPGEHTHEFKAHPRLKTRLICVCSATRMKGA